LVSKKAIKEGSNMLAKLSTVKPLRPLKKSSKKKAEYPKLPFSPTKIDRIIKLKEKMDNAKAEYESELDELRGTFNRWCKEHETKGMFYKTALAKGYDRKATITRKDQYSKISQDNAEYLSNMLGELFETFFQQETDAKLACSWEKFAIDAVASGFDNVQDYFELTDYIKIKSGTLNELSKLREKQPESSQVQILDEIIEQCQYKPSLRVKK